MRGNWVCRWATAGCSEGWRESRRERLGNMKERWGNSWGWLEYSWGRWENKREM